MGVVDGKLCIIEKGDLELGIVVEIWFQLRVSARRTEGIVIPGIIRVVLRKTGNPNLAGIGSDHVHQGIHPVNGIERREEVEVIRFCCIRHIGCTFQTKILSPQTGPDRYFLSQFLFQVHISCQVIFRVIKIDLGGVGAVIKNVGRSIVQIIRTDVVHVHQTVLHSGIHIEFNLLVRDFRIRTQVEAIDVHVIIQNTEIIRCRNSLRVTSPGFILVIGVKCRNAQYALQSIEFMSEFRHSFIPHSIIAGFIICPEVNCRSHSRVFRGGISADLIVTV
ncbi:hypothetical protein D3C86_1350390 [compost metagenome]